MVCEFCSCQGLKCPVSVDRGLKMYCITLFSGGMPCFEMPFRPWFKDALHYFVGGGGEGSGGRKGGGGGGAAKLWNAS